MNKVILIGNLANDPEAFTVNGDIPLSKFRIAVQRRFANAAGEREADFFQVVAWRQTANFCNRYLTKGRKIAVEGSIQNRSYEAQDGSKRWVTEIMADNVEAVGQREEDSRPADAPRTAPKREPKPEPKQDQFEEVDPGDELPF